MAITLTKGQKVDLTKDKPGLKTILVGLGWDEASESDDDDIDCDASCVLLDENDRVISEDMDECCVYFANESLYGIEHGGDNLTGEGEGDDETGYSRSHLFRILNTGKYTKDNFKINS